MAAGDVDIWRNLAERRREPQLVLHLERAHLVHDGAVKGSTKGDAGALNSPRHHRWIKTIVTHGTLERIGLDDRQSPSLS